MQMAGEGSGLAAPASSYVKVGRGRRPASIESATAQRDVSLTEVLAARRRASSVCSPSCGPLRTSRDNRIDSTGIPLMSSHGLTGAARIAVPLLAAGALILGGCRDPLSPAGEFAAATEAVDAWTAARPNAWSISAVGARAPQRAEWSKGCSASPVSGLVALEASAGATRLLLFFRCPAVEHASAAALQAAFSHVVLDELPHGLAVSNWSFSARTPSSSFSDGVLFSSPSSGRLRIAIATELYGLFGHSERPSCVPPADGPSLEGCYLFREHHVPLAVSVTVPWTGAELQ